MSTSFQPTLCCLCIFFPGFEVLVSEPQVPVPWALRRGSSSEVSLKLDFFKPPVHDRAGSSGDVLVQSGRVYAGCWQEGSQDCVWCIVDLVSSVGESSPWLGAAAKAAITLLLQRRPRGSNPPGTQNHSWL